MDTEGSVRVSANAWVSREHANAIAAADGGELEPASLPAGGQSDQFQLWLGSSAKLTAGTG